MSDETIKKGTPDNKESGLEEMSVSQLVLDIKKKLENKLDSLTKTVKKQEDLIRHNEALLDSLLKMVQGTRQNLASLNFNFEHFRKISISNADFCSGLETMIKEKKDLTHEALMSAVENIINARRKADIDMAIKQGTLIPADEISKQSYVVAKELNKEGEIISSRSQAPVAFFPKEYVEKLIGQKVGFRLDLSKGNVMEITEIYDTVSPKQPEPEVPPKKEESGSDK